MRCKNLLLAVTLTRYDGRRAVAKLRKSTVTKFQKNVPLFLRVRELPYNAE